MKIEAFSLHSRMASSLRSVAYFPLTMFKNKTYLLFTLLGSITGCGGNPGPSIEVPHLLSLPHSVAILITDNQHILFKNDSLMQHAYDRLESKSWRILSEQGGVRVVERRNLEVVRSEQHLQQLYAMDEGSAVRIGGLVGAQAVLLYHIRLPSWRDRILVEENSLPITFGGRLLEVETGTVLWSETVTIAPSHCHSDDCWFGGKPQATLWPTLEQGIDELVGEFSKAVPCRHYC
ncbi:MAG: hypothetical protein R3351_01955 [Nitrospirales bacterium]|nr:hypothetical protein [Nitrospirales bacterium]